MEEPLKEHYEVDTDLGTVVATLDYIRDLEKYIDFLESKFTEKFIKIDELRTTRKAYGVTLREMETEIGISNAYLSQLETGKITNPSFRVVDTLTRYFQNKKLNGFNNGKDTTEGIGGKEGPFETKI
jgi:DNA-binding XRE family transcriptional regulator